MTIPEEVKMKGKMKIKMKKRGERERERDRGNRISGAEALVSTLVNEDSHT